MLHLLRDFAKTWIAKILIAVLIVSFGAFGISNVVTNLGGNVVARVGDQDITASDFQLAYQQQLDAASRQLGKVPTSQEAVALGIPNKVISRLASDAALDSFASHLALGASRTHLIKVLQSEPAFQGPSGTFDKTRFADVLQQNGLSQAKYFNDTNKAALRQQVVLALFGDTHVPETAINLINRYSNDTRTLDYFVLDPVSLPSVAAPTEAQLQAYLKAHQAEFRTKETRKVDLLVLSPAILAKGTTFTPAQIKAEYERTKASLTQVEKRHIEQVTLTTDQVTAFKAGKAAGKSFTQLVATDKLKPTDLGTLSKTAITDSALADAAFGLKQGDFVIIPGISGQRAVTVTKIIPGGQISLADATPRLEKNLRLAAANTEIDNKLNGIENLRAANEPIAQVAKRYDLKATTVELTASGDELSAIPSIPGQDRAKVAKAVFAATKGALTPMVSLGENTNVWFDLEAITPARDETLAEVHDAVAKAWKADKTDAALKAEVNKLTDELKAGKSFDAVASSINQFPLLSPPITRYGGLNGGEKSKVLDARVAAAAFSGGVGHFGSAVDGDGDYVIFKVERMTPSSIKTTNNARSAIETSMSTSHTNAFVGAVLQVAGFKKNQTVLNQLLALGPNGR